MADESIALELGRCVRGLRDVIGLVEQGTVCGKSVDKPARLLQFADE